MVNISKGVGLLFIVLGVTSCGTSSNNTGWFRNRGQDYQHTKVTAPLKAPADVQPGQTEDRYDIPVS